MSLRGGLARGIYAGRRALGCARATGNDYAIGCEARDELEHMIHLHLSNNRDVLQESWNALCTEYLPITDGDSIWRYSRTGAEGDLEQGWKLHVSATILNAPQILDRIAPLLTASGVQFKAARSLDDVLCLNSGLLDSYSQVGKIITVYPRNDDEAVHLARRLHQLTYRFRAPLVPFDLRFRDLSNVYYRYGAFKRIELEVNGRRIQAVISASGEPVPDLRERPKPDWASDPFQSKRPAGKSQEPQARTSNSFRVVRALVQRGKGGVYQAIDVQSNPPRLCLLKEGRRRGELNWDGRDGAWRVRNEERVLARLSGLGVRVPRIYSRFEREGNFYLVMEFIDGESLHTLLLKQKKRLPIRRVLFFGLQIAMFLAQMHRAGWAWRDCKPQNVIIKSDGTLMPIDFEGAEQINRPDPLLWGTPGFVAPAPTQWPSASGLNHDRYALGSVLYLLITGRMFEDQQPIPIAKLRRNVPFELQRLVQSLLDVEPRNRPTAQSASLRLTTILRRLSERRPKLAETQAA